jgi:hypothetical protein
MSAPVRDGSRDGSAPRVVTLTCPGCGADLSSGRARHCSAACRQRAYRARHATPALVMAGRGSRHTAAGGVLGSAAGRITTRTVYECPECEQRFVGLQRCPDCHRFCRRLGPGGSCPHCDEPVLLADLLGEEVLL